MVHENTFQVKSYPKLAAAALRAGYPAAMRLYDLVQRLVASRNGNPFFSRANLTCLMEENAVDRALKEGFGLFWTRTEYGDYHMTARSKVAAKLGVIRAGRVVWLPIEAYTGRLSLYKAYIYAGYLAQLRHATESRDQLCERFGVTLPTLLEWERKIGVKTIARFVMVDPFEDDDLNSLYSQCKEFERERSARVWVSIVTPRGKVIAGRRLMDNNNEYLPDAASVVDEPGWEITSRPVRTFQTSNLYHSPIDTAPAGRQRWLKSEIKQHSRNDGPGGDDDPTPRKWEQQPGWHEDGYTAAKWQGRKWNRERPAIVVRKLTKKAVYAEWRSSVAARFAEI
jgi:hypothetical protein